MWDVPTLFTTQIRLSRYANARCCKLFAVALLYHPSNPVSSCRVASCPVPSHPVSIPSYPTLSHPIAFYPTAPVPSTLVPTRAVPFGRDSLSLPSEQHAADTRGRTHLTWRYTPQPRVETPPDAGVCAYGVRWFWFPVPSHQRPAGDSCVLVRLRLPAGAWMQVHDSKTTYCLFE